MTINFSLFDIRRILHYSLIEETIYGNLLINQISTDTRILLPGDVFVALRGENFDGHAFALKAIELGAIAIVVDQRLDLSGEIAQFVVKDTLAAYQAIAQGWRQRLKIPIIAVTGSVGKTTTKEMIAGALSLFGRVHKTESNNNNEIGVPKTLLDISPDHDFAIIEMGMRGRGEIALLTEITAPSLGLITNVGTAHIGRLGSEQAIAEAKCELLANMPATSTAILNYDNLRLMTTASQVWSGKTVTFGLEGGDIHGQLLDADTLQVAGMTFPLPLPGRHNAANFLAVLAIIQALGLDWHPLSQGISLILPSGRAQRYAREPDILLLDETYNAGLESMLAALQLLQETPGQRRIAVLGTMKELGERSEEFHIQVGKQVKTLGIDYLFLLVNDPTAQAIAKGSGDVPHEMFLDHSALILRLQDFIQAGDRVLFKASHSVQLDRVVENLKTF